MTVPILSVIGATLALLLTGCGSSEPQSTGVKDEPKPLHQEKGTAAVVISVGEFNLLDNGVPIEFLQVESVGNRDLCFDQVQLRGTGDSGALRFGFTISKASQDVTTVSPEVRGEPPTVKPEFFWRIPSQKAKRFQKMIVHDVFWIGDKHRELSVRLLFTHSDSERQTCDAPPAEPFNFHSCPKQVLAV